MVVSSHTETLHLRRRDVVSRNEMYVPESLRPEVFIVCNINIINTAGVGVIGIMYISFRDPACFLRDLVCFSMEWGTQV